MNRRSFLKTSAGAAALTAMGLPASVAHAASGNALKFVFVFAQGGWDPTRVFASEFANPNVDMELDAGSTTLGEITFVDHAARPSVRAFFEQNHERCAILNGILVRSIAHEICTVIAMTGNSSGRTPDWPALLASYGDNGLTIPHLVMGGPSFPGDLVTSVARTGNQGQLEGLLSGEIVGASDEPVAGFSLPTQNVVDRYVRRRARADADAALSARSQVLRGDYADAVDKASALKDLRYVMDFTSGADIPSQVDVAVDALAIGMSRCVTLGSGMGWDTHANNDDLQSANWESLFYGLIQLENRLRQTPGHTEATLADETVVVVLSEMGRTPQLNGVEGKDHWPYTSFLMFGPNLRSRVVGAYDANYYGLPLDPASGDVDEGGQILSAEAVGATLLAMADIDPGEHLQGIEPVMGVLS